MAGVTYREALRRALDEELARDERVFLMGEEIGRFEGSYKVTAGLLAKYGARRVRETPIAEEGFVGAGVGAAMLGLRPVVEIMTINFILVAMDKVVNHAAKIAPDVRRQGRRAARDPHARRRRRAADRAALAEPRGDVRAHARPQGRRAVDAADAYGLLKTAIRDDDPVLFVENLVLYNVSGALPEPGDDFTVPIGRAQVVREGTRPDDRRAQLHGAPRLTVADRLSQHGIEVEVVDLRSLRPLDVETVCNSVAQDDPRARAPRRAGRPTASAPSSPRASRATASTTSTRRSSASAGPRRRCRTPSRSSSPR